MNHQYLACILSCIAGFSTMIGSIFMFIDKKNKLSALSFTLPFSFIIILFICVFDLAPNAYKYLIMSNCDHSFIMTILFILIGIYIGKCINKINIKNEKYDKGLYRVGIMSFLVLMLHNIPEGIITFITSYDNLSFGIMMTLVIAMHNIPEGIMISMPIYFSTGSKLKGFLYTLISGFAEPIGAVIAWLFLTNLVSNTFMGIILSIVCGLMLHMVIDEIYPIMNKYNVKKCKYLGVIVAIIFILCFHFLVK